MRAMASSRLQQPDVGLLGRERECAVIDRLLENAHEGMSGALVVHGEAGIGKSALLGYAIQRGMPGMLVLRAERREASLIWHSPGCTSSAARRFVSPRAAADAILGAGGCAGSWAVN